MKASTSSLFAVFSFAAFSSIDVSVAQSSATAVGANSPMRWYRDTITSTSDCVTGMAPSPGSSRST